MLVAALDVFAELGFQGASVDAVATRAGFTKGAVYSNFTSKDQLFLALMDRQVEDRVADVVSLVAPLDEGLDPDAVGAAIAARAIEDQRWQMVFLDYWARAVRDPDVRDRFVDHRRRLRAKIATTIEPLLATRPDAPSAADLALLVLIMSNGFAIEALADPEAVSSDVLGVVAKCVLSETDSST